VSDQRDLGEVKYHLVREVALVLRLSKAKTYELVEKGVLPAVRLPGTKRIVIDDKDLVAYIEKGRTVPR
jgi:excisionase family DNA binding protein